MRLLVSKQWISTKVCNLKPKTQFRPSTETRSSYGRNRNLAETTNLASFGAVTETETEIRSVSSGDAMARDANVTASQRRCDADMTVTR